MDRLQHEQNLLDTTLLDDDRAKFDRQGFLGPIKIYEPEEARAILHQIRIGNTDRTNAVFDNDVNYDRHFDIPELSRHVGSRAILEKVRKFIGPDVLCWRSEFFPKFPGSAGTEWHQVANYQYATGMPMIEPTEPDDGRPLDVTVWTAFTDATKENGCMKFLPGSHKRIYYDESKPVQTGRDASYTSVSASTQFFGYDFQEFKVDPAWSPDESVAVAMEMKAGECVIFSAKCVHGSFPNSTKRSTRFAITARYVPTHVRVYPGWEIFSAHGGQFDLSKWGCVLVAGVDPYGHNRIRTENNFGERFPCYEDPRG